MNKIMLGFPNGIATTPEGDVFLWDADLAPEAELEAGPYDTAGAEAAFDDPALPPEDGTGTGGTGSGTGGTGTGGSDDTGGGTGGTGPSTGTALTVDGGRVTTIEIGGNKTVTAVEILDGPDHGNLTVNPDLSLSLVLSDSDFSGADSFDIKITYANGSTETRTTDLTVSAPQQQAGWGKGQHYMLETDAAGDLVIETGDNHRKVYVSESDAALTKADIAALEGVSEATVTGKWLKDNHPEYGGSEGMALATDIGMDLWYALTPWTDLSNSNWLMFERGHTYENTGRIINIGVTGESALTPIYVSSWGTGDRPELTDQIKIFQSDSANIVFDKVALAGGMLNLTGSNVILNESEFTGAGLNIQEVSGFTLRDSELSYIVAEKPDADYWSGIATALFVKDTAGILLEDNIFHHIGWEDDYRYDRSTDGGMPPNMFSHNLYLQNDTTDVTVRDNIFSQGASFGAHIRGGGYVEDNVFVDNNAAVDFLGGVYHDDGPIGNYTFFADNVITSGGHKTVNGAIGGLTVGLIDKGYDTTFLNNIIAHLADPNNPAELAEKTQTHDPFDSENDPAFDDTIIFNWIGSNPQLAYHAITNNTPGLNEALANQTTIQNFAAAVMNTPGATIGDLMGHILALADTAADDSLTADDIIAYFQAGFGVTASGDGSASMHRFVPNELAGGIRWDNRINWDNEELPDAGDSVDLGGNFVQYGGTTVLEDLELAGGKLYVNHGKLTVTDELNTKGGPALVQTLNAGQFWTEGYDGAKKLKFDIDGGRFANTGDIHGKTLMEVTDGQAILATDGGNYILTGDSEMHIVGSTARVGFDGASNGLAVLTMQDGSLLRFAADATGFSTIEEFRSGAWNQTGTPVKSGVSLNGTLKIDLTDYAGGADSFELIAVDKLLGELDDVEIVGLASNLNAKVIVNYKTDTVSLDLLDGGGHDFYKTIGGTTLEGGIAHADTSAGMILA